MKIWDITKPFFATEVYPGDPVPGAKSFLSVAKGDLCNLHQLTCGTHTGTHMDAPFHFYMEGKTIDQVNLQKCIGPCLVASAQGILGREELKSLLETADSEKLPERLLIRGNAILTPDGAQYLTERGVSLYGTELSTVGDAITGKDVHLTLLGSEIVILENLDLKEVEPGRYFLMAQPLKLEGMDGSPIRALLTEM